MKTMENLIRPREGKDGITYLKLQRYFESTGEILEALVAATVRKEEKPVSKDE